MKNRFSFLVFLIFYCFILSAQSIDYIFPTDGEQGETLVITVSGENTNWTQSTNVLSFKQGSETTLYPNSQTVNSDTEIVGTFSFEYYDPIGYYDVSVYDYGSNTELLLSNGFYLEGGEMPMIVSVDPSEEEQGETFEVTVTGANTSWTEGENVLTFRQASETVGVSSQTINSDTEIVGTVTFTTDDSTGYYNVVVEDILSGEAVSFGSGFYLHEEGAWWIEDVEPGIGEQGETLEVTVTGHSTIWTEGSTQLQFEQGSGLIIYPESQVVNSDTEIVGTFSLTTNDNLGYWHVWVYNTNQDIVEYNGFRIIEENPVGIDSLLPDYSLQADQVFITIYTKGTNFLLEFPDVYFKKGTTTINPIDGVVINDTEVILEFQFNPDQALGLYDVHVNTSDDELVMQNGFELLPPINEPVLNSLSPDNSFTEVPITMQITGDYTHFNHPDITNIIKLLDGNTIIIGENIIASDSNNLQVDFNFTNMHPPGLYDLYLENELDGSMMLFDSFTLIQNPDVPYVESVEPDSVYSSEDVWINVNGENTTFLDGDITMKLVNDRDEIFPVELNVINDTTIEAFFDFTPGYGSGYYDLHVFDEDGRWYLLKVNCVHLDPVVFTPEINQSEIARVFPNPANEKVYFEYSANSTSMVKIDIFNVSGNIVRSEVRSPKQKIVEFDVKDLESGVYLVKIRQDGKVQTTKVIIH